MAVWAPGVVDGRGTAMSIPATMVLGGPPGSPPAHDEGSEDVGTQHEGKEHESARPRLAVPVVVGGDRIGEDHDRKRGGRSAPARAPEPVVERREEEGS